MTSVMRDYTLFFWDSPADTPDLSEMHMQGCGCAIVTTPSAVTVLGHGIVESQREWQLTMNSNPAHIPWVISWLLKTTAWMLPEIQRLNLRGALQELLLNAVEHGNLEMFYQRKQQAVAEGWYEELLMQRLTKPCFKDRQVTVRVCQEWNVKRMTYHIADEGNGFAWRRFWAQPLNTAAIAVSGRGIALTRWVFPSLTYNELGNEVTIIVPLA